MAANRAIRRKILASVGALVMLCLVGSSASLYRITEVNRTLDAINRTAVPFGRLLVQIQSDAEVLKREIDRRRPEGRQHFQAGLSGRISPSIPTWPKWIDQVIQSELERAKLILSTGQFESDVKDKWQAWFSRIGSGYEGLRTSLSGLLVLLQEPNVDLDKIHQAQSRLDLELNEWVQSVGWGVQEHERGLRQTFARAEAKVSALRTGMEILLTVVVSLSLLLLWFGERALRPLSLLAELARNIARRGVMRDDKALLMQIAGSRNDELSELARDFHAMATALIEREKIVEHQKGRLTEQNRLLTDLGALNSSVLKSIRSILIVGDWSGKITQLNPVAQSWLGQGNATSEASEKILGTSLSDWPKLSRMLPELNEIKRRLTESGEFRLKTSELEGRIYGGRLMPLLSDEVGEALSEGFVLDLVDLTEDLALQERLGRAESLAVVGRMSAQVAHEIRNPLHSIGLEAELATEVASKPSSQSNSTALKQSLQSIQASVDRLNRITENYLKLSRLSSGQKKAMDLAQVLEVVLATYTNECESAGVEVDWNVKDGNLEIWGDEDLIEQALGNLFRNALQAVSGSETKKIIWSMGQAESGRIWLTIEDSGHGLTSEVKAKLFTPYFTTRAQGTGLGLSFVKKLIEEHGGQISGLDSKTLGGAKFEMVFPHFSEIQNPRSDRQKEQEATWLES